MTDVTLKAVDLGAKALETAYKHRSTIIPALKAGIKRLKDGKVTVAIFGPGGVGKSTTQTLLAEGLDKVQKQMTYYPTVDTSKSKLKNNWTISIWAALLGRRISGTPVGTMHSADLRAAPSVCL